MRGVVLLVALTACTGVVSPPAPYRPGPGGSGARPGPLEPAPSLARRLTRDEVAFTVADRLGVTLTADEWAELPEDLPLGGFVNTAQGQATLPDHVLAYDALARGLVERLDRDALYEEHAPCRAVDIACGEALVDGVGARLFRRPVRDAERAAFVSLFLEVATEGVGFDECARATLRAMLQAPQFLYILTDDARDPEGPTERPASDYEIASRLSYFLWRSAPDAALEDAAARGELSTPAQIEAQATRMLADEDRARRATELFLVDWARLAVIPDDDGLRDELVATAVAFYQRHLWDEAGGVAALLSAPSAALTPTLATAYGLTPLGDGIQHYDLAVAPGRLGLLAQPGVLAGMTNADGGQIVTRGLFLQRQLLCREPPSPPVNLDAIIEEFVAEQPPDASERDLAEVRLARGSCGECHSAFDPLAFALEAFDYRGGYRVFDAHDNRLRTDGWIPAAHTGGRGEVVFDDMEGFARALADNPQVSRCMVQQHLQYALGTSLDAGQEAAVHDITERMTPEDGYRALALAIVTHEVFRTVRLDPREAE